MNKVLLLSLSFSLPLMGMDSKISIDEQLQQKYAAIEECESKYNQESQQVGIARQLPTISYLVAAACALYNVARFFGFGDDDNMKTEMDNIVSAIGRIGYSGICVGYAIKYYNANKNYELRQQKNQNIRLINKEIEDLRTQQLLQAIHNNAFQKK